MTETPHSLPTGPTGPAAGPTPPLAGRYVLVDQIGLGGMGTVWRAWDLRTQQFVAAKVLGQHDGGMLLRFVREQSVRIQHPHVVAPSGWAAEDNLVVFTMDLVRGGSVQTLLGDHGPLPESYVSVLLDQTLQALEAIHGAGVVHRDIKPANLLLEATGTGRPVVRVGDFGVAALVDDVRLTRFPGAIGTDGYMAPEQVRGAAPDPRQDLYALGIVAVQLLTGQAPRQQAAHDPAPAGRLKPLLDAMTSHDVDVRPPSAAAALGYLRQLGVPPGSPWQSDPEPPEVFDQLGDVPVPSTPTHATGPASGAPVGSGTPSGPGGYADPQGPPSGPATPPAPAAGPALRPGSAEPATGAAPGTAPAATGSTGSTGNGATLVAIACFVVALVLAGIALLLVLR
ncbi:serine/threonine protein kinase [Nocardioides sp. KIGAM211]|uniref:Serine/threonine protein kinase n=1 Tax=Nocardioides luti TaxID=2761101 RepID=A0A7X0VB36_9ACTN|nr:serine/threonine-protein kinase [Nocardioides luti]MBB6627975.1 serine/threonine protein kinase [Nocardioides luti]